MKKPILLVLLSLCIVSCFAQTIIEGTIKDKRMKPIVGASIAIKNSYDGAVSDSAGRFKFTTSGQEKDTLLVTSTGYEDFDEVLETGKSTDLNIVLKEAINELNAVTVTAGAFSAGDAKKGVVLSALDIVTTATNGDITTALRTLPGAQQVGEQEGLFVRGGTGDETKQYMDGAVISNPYFRGPPEITQRGRFNPFLFSGTVFSTGGYSAIYGDALSSVVLLTSNALPDKSEVDLSVSPLFLGAGTQQLSKSKKSSFGLNYGYTNVSLYFDVIKTKPDFFKAPQYHTADFNYRVKTKWGGMIKYYTSFGYNKVGMRNQDVDSLYLKDQFDVKSANWYNNLNWIENLGKRWKMYWSNSFSINSDKIKEQIVDVSNRPKQFDTNTYWMNLKNFDLKNSTDNLQSRIVFEKKLEHLNAIRFGGEYNYEAANLLYNNYPVNLQDNYGALFAETDTYFSNHFMMKLGGRGEYSTLLQQSNWSPRLSFAYSLGANAQMSAAYGMFYQKPETMFLMYNRHLDFTKATHYIINYQKTGDRQLFRIEAYYKDYDKLIKTVPLKNGTFTYNNNGSGYAKGVDIFWRDKKTFKNFEYWVSYSYLDTKRDYLNYSETLQPDYATPHTFSVVGKKFFQKLKTQVNLTYSFATGRPYYHFMPNSNHGYDLTDKGATIDYNNVGLSVDYLPNLGKANAKSNIIIVATISNLLDNKQIYGYNYSYNGSYKTPVLPSARQFFFIGVFFTWGVDRSQQIINDNL
ncbi:TonB-dependent receptor [Arachidicoccus sp.]|uniref:TonB-dependent receptor n=1 Tax=Arachidicoccus sp. TaxID=1872624 RepID=UPI003D194ED5